MTKLGEVVLVIAVTQDGVREVSTVTLQELPEKLATLKGQVVAVSSLGRLSLNRHNSSHMTKDRSA